jgi:hypothetical protein
VNTERIPIKAANSTVNGRKARADRSAIGWLDGWKGLALEDERVYRDGHRCKIQADGIFGWGRMKGFSCGEYLHVPVRGESQWCRVRSRLEPGMRDRGGHLVESVRAQKINGKWHWIIRRRKSSLRVLPDGREIAKGYQWTKRVKELRKRAGGCCEAWRILPGHASHFIGANGDPHHIVKRSISRDDRLENLLWICRQAHWEIHQKRLT